MGSHVLRDPDGTVAESELNSGHSNSETAPTCVEAHRMVHLDPAASEPLQPAESYSLVFATTSAHGTMGEHVGHTLSGRGCVLVSRGTVGHVNAVDAPT